MKPTQFQFARRVLNWFDKHGRKELPWQQGKTPYRVWVSEIMLQQTQVSTVIGYFDRFMKRFPDIKTLAHAPQDEVLHLWTGLGYYARARNLHRAAQQVLTEFNGEFPKQHDLIQTLPGIGRSTAAAICAICYGHREAILDGNVKRVLARFFGIAGWPGESKVAEKLWHAAESILPKTRLPDYTQAMMDIGATLCTRTKPGCTDCPLAQACVAYAKEAIATYPGKKKFQPLPVKATYMVMFFDGAHAVFLKQRPNKGLWGGLWCFPQVDALMAVKREFGISALQKHTWPSFRHTFTHFHLDITPVLVTVKPKEAVSLKEGVWYDLFDPPQCGLAKPVKSLLEQLEESLCLA